jgi:LL-diaminopimelate aminotransferase
MGIAGMRAKRLDLVPPYLFSEIARTKREVMAAGKDVVDFGIGDPDQPTPRPIIDALAAAAADPRTHVYDESASGYAELLSAGRDWYRHRFGVDLDPEREMLALIGSKEGLAHFCWAVVDPGDLVLYPDPGYTVYKVNALFAGGEIFAMPLLEQNSFLPDLDRIPEDAANRSRIMFLNYPNNPTGAVADASFFERAVEYARANGILICHDCAYSEVAFGATKPPSILSVPGAKEVAIEFHSLSKCFNMTGWRVGFAVGNADAVAALRTLKSNTDSKQFGAVQLAGAAALRLGPEPMKPTFELYSLRRRKLIEGLRTLGCRLADTGATFYVWAPTPGGTESIPFAKRLLEEANVLAIPGIGYGEHGEGYIRFSVTVQGDRDGDRVDEAIRRLDESGIRWD